MEMLGWLEAASHGKEGLKCASTICGQQFVTAVGVVMMPKLCAPSLATLEQVHAYTVQCGHSVL